MNLGASEAVRSIAKRLKLFIQEIVIPHENAYEEELESDRWQIPNVMTEPRIGQNQPACSAFS